MPTRVNAMRPRKHTFETVAELVAHFGGIPGGRIRLEPAPGTATEKDAVSLAESADKRLCELIDGTLVEKTAGARESLLAAYLIEVLGPFVRTRNLGLVLGADGRVRLFRGQVRTPDVSFVSWDSLPGGRVPRKAVLASAPNLVVEVLSKGNTRAEMGRERRDYFGAGGKLFWEIDPKKRLVRVFTAREGVTVRGEAETLDGGQVLPGFRLELRALFGELDRRK